MTTTRRSAMMQGLAFVFATGGAPTISQSATKGLTQESVIETVNQDGVIRISLSVLTPGRGAPPSRETGRAV